METKYIGCYRTLLLYVSNTIRFSIRPIPEISTSTTSPSMSSAGGDRATPTPAGVPVMITVPFRSVIPRLKYLIRLDTSNIKSSVLPSCLNAPLTLVLRERVLGSDIKCREHMTGPKGANLSKDLA